MGDGVRAELTAIEKFNALTASTRKDSEVNSDVTELVKGRLEQQRVAAERARLKQDMVVGGRPRPTREEIERWKGETDRGVEQYRKQLAEGKFIGYAGGGVEGPLAFRNMLKRQAEAARRGWEAARPGMLEAEREYGQVGESLPVGVAEPTGELGAEGLERAVRVQEVALGERIQVAVWVWKKAEDGRGWERGGLVTGGGKFEMEIEVGKDIVEMELPEKDRMQTVDGRVRFEITTAPAILEGGKYSERAERFVRPVEHTDYETMAAKWKQRGGEGAEGQRVRRVEWPAGLRWSDLTEEVREELTGRPVIVPEAAKERVLPKGEKWVFKLVEQRSGKTMRLDVFRQPVQEWEWGLGKGTGVSLPDIGEKEIVEYEVFGQKGWVRKAKFEGGQYFLGDKPYSRSGEVGSDEMIVVEDVSKKVTKLEEEGWKVVKLSDLREMSRQQVEVKEGVEK